MKKIILLCILLMVAAYSFAPVNKSIAIIESQPICIYDRLIYAVTMVESSGNNYAYNQFEGAYGAFQIRAIRLTDYNKRTGKSLLLKDCYDYNTSKEIFLYYAALIGNDMEKIAKSWNGSGVKTIEYWNKIKVYL